MALNQIQLVLTTWRAGGEPLEPSELLTKLGVDPEPYTAYGYAERWRSVCIRAGPLLLSDFAQGDDCWSEFERAVGIWLTQFAGWLAGVRQECVERMRSEGIDAQVIVNLELDSGQFDLTLPPELCAELGRLRLPIYILSNE